MAIALLLTALLLPVVSFWLLSSRLRQSFAAVISIAAGWLLNIAWAFTANESTGIATAFGWLCPLVLVLVTWFVMRLKKRRIV
jgi:hypothetical protein